MRRGSRWWWGTTRACDPSQEPRWGRLGRSIAVPARPVQLLVRGRGGSTRWLQGTAVRAGGVQGPNLQRFRLALPPSGSATNFLSNALPLPYLGVHSAISTAGSLTLCLAEFQARRTDRRGRFKNSKLLATPLTRSVALLKCVGSAILSQSISR